jgi:hypothetical protein
MQVKTMEILTHSRGSGNLSSRFDNYFAMKTHRYEEEHPAEKNSHRFTD